MSHSELNIKKAKELQREKHQALYKAFNQLILICWQAYIKGRIDELQKEISSLKSEISNLNDHKYINMMKQRLPKRTAEVLDSLRQLHKEDNIYKLVFSEKRKEVLKEKTRLRKNTLSNKFEEIVLEDRKQLVIDLQEIITEATEERTAWRIKGEQLKQAVESGGVDLDKAYADFKKNQENIDSELPQSCAARAFLGQMPSKDEIERLPLQTVIDIGAHAVAQVEALEKSDPKRQSDDEKKSEASTTVTTLAPTRALPPPPPTGGLPLTSSGRRLSKMSPPHHGGDASSQNQAGMHRLSVLPNQDDSNNGDPFRSSVAPSSFSNLALNSYPYRYPFGAEGSNNGRQRVSMRRSSPLYNRRGHTRSQSVVVSPLKFKTPNK